MKKLLLAAGAILALVLLLLALVPMFVNPERFRPMVETKAREALGREVKIGKLDFSLLRGAVIAYDLTVADDPKFSSQPFLAAKSLRIGVDVMPLILSQQANVKGIVLDEPQITVISQRGKWNFESLGAAQQAGQPGKTSQRFSIDELKVADGMLTVRQGNGRAREYSEIQAEIENVSPKSVSPFSVSATAPGGGTIEVTGKLGPLNMGSMAESPLTADVKTQNLDLAQTGFLPADTGIAGLIDYDGKIKSNGKTLDSAGKVTAKRLRLVKSGQPATIPVTVDYASLMDVVSQRGTISRGDISFGRGMAHLTGNFASKGATTILNARLRGEGLPIDNVEGLLPAIGVMLPQGTRLQGGAVSTDLAIAGPLNALVTSGPINVVNSKVAGFNLKQRASGLSQLAGLPSASDLIIQAFNSKMHVAPEGMRADGISVVVPGLGTVTGDGVISANNALNFRMKARLTGGNLIGGLSQIASFGQSKGEIPFLIQGSTSNPIFIPDVGAAMANSMKGTINAPVKGSQQVGGFLGGLFGKKPK